MKFLKYLVFASILVNSKKVHKDPSQTTRNYRHLHTDLSYNPLRANWATGPRDNFAQHAQKKHKAYNSILADQHHYHETTRELQQRAASLY
jgi:hypothetical protein